MGILNKLKNARDSVKNTAKHAVINFTSATTKYISRATDRATTWFKQLTSSTPASAHTADTQERIESFNKVKKALPSNFSLVYTSKDGRYCLFETKDGNLISAETNKLV